MSHTQDWNPVVIHGSQKAAAPKGQKTPNYTPQAAALRKLENDPDASMKRKELSVASRQEMTQRRASAGMTQIQLNQRCAFPLNTIRDIESGRLCPNPQQLSILNRVFGSKLSLS